MLPGERLEVPTGRLTDSEVRMLRDAYARASARLPAGPLAAFAASMARALDHVLSERLHVWLDVLNDPATPPSWDLAVDALAWSGEAGDSPDGVR